MQNLRKYFISGIVVFLPLAMTVFLFVWIISLADGLLGRFLKPYFAENYFRGLSIMIFVSLIVLIGFFVTNFIGQRIFQWYERLLLRLPFFKQVYPAIKEMAIFLFSRDQLKSFKQVVLVEYPRKGIYVMGFLTNDASSKICELTKKDLCNVFISSSPSPLTGFTIVISRKEIVYTDIKIEEAFKFILSGGVVNPQ